MAVDGLATFAEVEHVVCPISIGLVLWKMGKLEHSDTTDSYVAVLYDIENLDARLSERLYFYVRYRSTCIPLVLDNLIETLSSSDCNTEFLKLLALKPTLTVGEYRYGTVY